VGELEGIVAVGAEGMGAVCVVGIGATGAGGSGGDGGVAGMGLAGIGGGGGGCMLWSCASSEPASVIEPMVRSARKGLRDFIVVTPCQNAWLVDGCARCDSRDE